MRRMLQESLAQRTMVPYRGDAVVGNAINDASLEAHRFFDRRSDGCTA